MVRLVPSSFLFLAAVGCSSGSGGSGGGGNAPAQCFQLLDQWCGKAADCGVQLGQLSAGERGTAFDECQQQAQAVAGCSDAVAVGPSYSACIADIDAMSCSTFASQNVSLPGTCQGVIEKEPRSSPPPAPIPDDG
jgi:hypothetical protein